MLKGKSENKYQTKYLEDDNKKYFILWYGNLQSSEKIISEIDF